MKKLLLLITATLIATLVHANWKPFINKGGVYKEFDEKTDIVPSFKDNGEYNKGSLSYFAHCLGFSSGEYITYIIGNDAVVLNAFNGDVLFVLVDENKSSLTQQEVDKMLSKYSPNIEEFRMNLKEGIEERNIRQSFVEESLGVQSVDNTIKDNSRGYTYVFTNGIMVDYKHDSGYSDDALFVKENWPQLLEILERNAKRYYSSTLAIVKYINGQSKYIMKIPQAYLKKAPNYNFALLYCILYEGMTLDEFTFLVPEAQISSTMGNYVTMSYGNYFFTFKNKILVKH